MKRMFAIAILLGLSNLVMAIPTLQVYGVDSVAYDAGNDEDTWLLTGAGTHTLELIGTYGPNTSSITNAFLVMTTSAHDGNLFDPGLTKYDDSDAFEASLAAIDPSMQQFNNHAPYGLHSSLIDIYAFDLALIGMDSFGAMAPTKDCNADVPGTTECAAAPNSIGQIFSLNFDLTGIALDWIHFDLVALVTDKLGQKKLVSTWEINPGSHDTTWQQVPEPASLALLGLGLLGLGLVRRRAK